MKILAVDDSRSIRALIEAVLENKFDLTLAEDGQQAYEKVQSEHFDLIISDVNMPNMSGLQFLEKTRQLPDYVGTPILMLTTESEQHIKAEGRRLGATGWIVKPFNPDSLLKVIQKVAAS